MRLKSVVEIFHNLAQKPRRGWIMRDVENPETTYEHCRDIRDIALEEARQVNARLDPFYCGEMGMSHDLSDYASLDITPHDLLTPRQKKRHEASGILVLLSSTYPADVVDQLVLLRREHERGRSPAASFTRQLDRLQLAEKAGFYEREQDKHMPEMWVYADQGITDPHLRKRLTHARSQRPRDVERRPPTPIHPLSMQQNEASIFAALARLTPEWKAEISAEREAAFARYPLVNDLPSRLLRRTWSTPLARYFI